MQMIEDCIKPEALEAFKKVLDREQHSPEVAAAKLDEAIRKRQDRLEELADMNRHERRKARALAR